MKANEQSLTLDEKIDLSSFTTEVNMMQI